MDIGRCCRSDAFLLLGAEFSYIPKLKAVLQSEPVYLKQLLMEHYHTHYHALWTTKLCRDADHTSAKGFITLDSPEIGVVYIQGAKWARKSPQRMTKWTWPAIKMGSIGCIGPTTERKWMSHRALFLDVPEITLQFSQSPSCFRNF